MDSPVKVSVARKMPRCAPPYTIGTREEPCQGDLSVVIGPDLPLTDGSVTAAQLHQSGHSCIVQHFVG